MAVRKLKFIYDSSLPKRLNDFLIYMKTMQGKSAHTLNGYKSDNGLMLRYLKYIQFNEVENVDFKEVKKVDISLIDDDFIKKITYEDLCMFIGFLEEKGNGKSDRGRKVSAIKSFFNYLVRKAKLISSEFNPAIELEKPDLGKKNPVYLSIADSKKLLDTIKYDLNYKRDFCIITLFLNCGLRVSEMCNIDIDNIKEDMVNILAGKGEKDRTAYLNSMCIEALDQWLNERETKEGKLIDDDSKKALFLNKNYSRLSTVGVEELVKKWVKKAGLDPRITPHKLRHSFCTMMYTSGVDIRSLQELMGHETISTTELYTHLNDTNLRNAVKLNPLNSST